MKRLPDFAQNEINHRQTTINWTFSRFSPKWEFDKLPPAALQLLVPGILNHKEKKLGKFESARKRMTHVENKTKMSKQKGYYSPSISPPKVKQKVSWQHVYFRAQNYIIIICLKITSFSFRLSVTDNIWWTRKESLSLPPGNIKHPDTDDDNWWLIVDQ
jgi:hypothetical protein